MILSDLLEVPIDLKSKFIEKKKQKKKQKGNGTI